jgi:hypothetical protein
MVPLSRQLSTNCGPCVASTIHTKPDDFGVPALLIRRLTGIDRDRLGPSGVFPQCCLNIAIDQVQHARLITPKIVLGSQEFPLGGAGM